jgi:hypothetical protein
VPVPCSMPSTSKSSLNKSLTTKRSMAGQIRKNICSCQQGTTHTARCKRVDSRRGIHPPLKRGFLADFL